MPFRVSFFFTVQQALTSGWSENYYNQKTDATQVLAVAEDLRGSLLRAKGQGVYCPRIRVSDLGNFRSIRFASYPGAVQVGPTGTGLVDYVNTAALFVLLGNPNYKQQQWYRGVPDNCIDQGGFWDPTAQEVRLINTIFGKLSNAGNGWSLRNLDKNVAKVSVSAITTAGVVTAPGHGLLTNDITRISRVITPTSINKLWRVIKIDNDTFSLVGFTTLTTAPIVGLNTSSRKQSYTFVSISGGRVERATSHKTGRPFGLSIGRRRTRRAS